MLGRQPPVPDLVAMRAALDPNPALEGGWRLDRTAAAARLDPDQPLVSVVTVTFNAAKVLGETLDSVRRQTYRNIEHIVVDGGSRDGTVDVIRANEDHVAYWRSEPDSGIYDAFNKGIALARGKYVGILNADDFYEPDQIEKAVAALEETGAPFVHGNITMHGWQGQDVDIHGDPCYEVRIAERMPSLHHVTTLARLDVFKQHGLFMTAYKIAGDYDWYLRLTQKGVIGLHVPAIHGHMRAGGISTTQQRRSLAEVFLISRRHGLPLWRALRTTGPLILYPNGLPQGIERLRKAVKNPRSAMRGVRRRLFQRMRPSRPEAGEPTSLLNVLAIARHITDTVDPVGLEWIYGAGLRARSFHCAVEGREAAAASQLLRAAGLLETPIESKADIVVIAGDEEGFNQAFHASPGRTILLVRPTAVHREALKHCALDFTGIVAVGALVDPTQRFRQAK